MVDHSHPHVRIETDAANSTTSLQDIPGLAFDAVAGKKYLFGFVVRYDSAATTGSRFGLKGPAGTVSYISSTVKAAAGRNWSNCNGWDQPTTASTTSMGNGNLAVIDGELLATASGKVQARFASSKAGSAVTTHGGTCWYQEL